MNFFCYFLQHTGSIKKTVILSTNLSNFTLRCLLLEVDPTLEFQLEFLKNWTDAVCLCYIIPTGNLKNTMINAAKQNLGRTFFDIHHLSTSPVKSLSEMQMPEEFIKKSRAILYASRIQIRIIGADGFSYWRFINLEFINFGSWNST